MGAARFGGKYRCKYMFQRGMGVPDLEQLDHGGGHLSVRARGLQQLLLQVDGLPQLCGAARQHGMQIQ